MRQNHFIACLDCTERRAGCQVECASYKAAKEAYSREKEAENAVRHREAAARGFAADSVRSLQKKKGLKKP